MKKLLLGLLVAAIAFSLAFAHASEVPDDHKGSHGFLVQG